MYRTEYCVFRKAVVSVDDVGREELRITLGGSDIHDLDIASDALLPAIYTSSLHECS